MPPPDQRLLLIGLDAADPVLVQDWITRGDLPHLAGLQRRGTTMRLETSARHLAGSPWPTFFTGQHPTGHGLYADFQWRHETMEFAAPTPDWIDPVPFWRELEDEIDIVVYDVPFVTQARCVRGVEIVGWATHDKLLPPNSYPDSLLAEVERRFGSWHVSYEAYGPAPVAELLALRDEMIENTRRSTELILWLLERDWQLALVCLSALHRGGHRLFDRSSIKGEVTAAEGAAFDDAMRQLYIAADTAVGRLVEAFPEVDIVVFSLHGMMTNIARADLLDDMLRRVLEGPTAKARKGLVRQLGEALPYPLRRAVSKRIPRVLQDRLMTAWATGGIDWQKTPAFCCRADLQGYVRLNLKGREAQGCVEPGPEAEALVARIREGLMSFRDADTGKPLIDDVVPAEDVLPPGPVRDRIPDLFVMWRETSQAGLRAVQSDSLGTIRRAAPGEGNGPNGRSGNHRPEGILIAAGRGIPKGRLSNARPHTVDLAPTVLRRLDLHSRAPLVGTVIDELAGLR
jgi:predicted AlkP superfamily phosphohydrolase/phosphomutase